MSTLHYPHASRGIGRIGTSGLRVRTHNLAEAPPSGIKLKGIASADWRRSPGASRRNESRSSASGTISARAIEMENIDPKSYLFRPNEEQAPWEMVVSSPGSKCPASSLYPASSVSSGRCMSEGLPVQLKSYKLMTMNVNGEDIILDNSFTFEIAPLGWDRKPSGGDPSAPPVGVLKRIEPNSGHYRRLSRRESSSDCSFIFEKITQSSRPVDIAASPSSRTSSRKSDQWSTESVWSRCERQSEDSGKRSNSTAPTSVSGVSSGPQVPETKGTDDQDRYQHLLRRLNKRSAPIEAAEKPVKDIKDTDPAIVAAKVKDTTDSSEDSGSSSSSTLEAFGRIWHEKNNWLSLAKQRILLGPDYSAIPSAHAIASSVRPTKRICSTKLSTETVSSKSTVADKIASLDPINESAESDQLTTRLNPAAAEFRSSFDEKVFPMSPKKLTRPPLSNLFPSAAQKDVAADSVSTTASLEQPEALKASRPREPSKKLPSTQTPTTIRPPPGLGFVDEKPPQRGEMLQFTPMFPPMHSSMQVPPVQMGYLYNANTFPMAGMLPPVDTRPIHAPNMNGFNTFPPPSFTVPGPIMAQKINAPVGIAPPTSAAPLSPLYLADNNSARPHFPVTQKPRDHDPIKQQMYEAYLEWRKANEPGYHLKCKMRQAQRAMRLQEQSRSATTSSSLNACEKPKTRGSASEDEEKRKKQEMIREELRRKVQLASEAAKREIETAPKDTAPGASDNSKESTKAIPERETADKKQKVE